MKRFSLLLLVVIIVFFGCSSASQIKAPEENRPANENKRVELYYALVQKVSDQFMKYFLAHKEFPDISNSNDYDEALQGILGRASSEEELAVWKQFFYDEVGELTEKTLIKHANTLIGIIYSSYCEGEYDNVIFLSKQFLSVYGINPWVLLLLDLAEEEIYPDIPASGSGYYY